MARGRALAVRSAGLELWGGPECTVNRIGDLYRDQTVLSGHQHRIGDLELFAAVGFKALRYPLLWERIAPNDPEARDWAWTDARVAQIQRLGMRVIAGLLHHGSGPSYTSLVSDDFAAGLARQARATAERYPEIGDWTPVNEPLTTARFSALYGHWYPHARDERTFWLALLNQVDGVRGAMREVRAVNPAARLIQTEDLGQAYGTPPFAEEVAFQNARRWMTWDLLCGRVTPGHDLWKRLRRFGFAARLDAIADDPCPPDVLGINFYPTSERFLDHRAALYPQWSPGDREQFDMDAVRVLQPPPVGLEGLMRQAWERYRVPLAVTESHLHASVSDQISWIGEAWTFGAAMNAQGARVEAVTSWALLGSFDWNSLLTRQDGFYEPGAFDVSSGSPQATGLLPTLSALAGEDPQAWVRAHARDNGPGWWRKPARLTLPAYDWGATGG